MTYYPWQLMVSLMTLVHKRAFMPLNITKSGDLVGCYRCLTHWLTHSLTTLKDRATQLLIKYKRRAHVTQLNVYFGKKIICGLKWIPWFKWLTLVRISGRGAEKGTESFQPVHLLGSQWPASLGQSAFKTLSWSWRRWGFSALLFSSWLQPPL